MAGVLAAAALSATLGAAGANEASRVFFHGPRTDRVVALTFDDGWTPSNCAKVDRILQGRGVAATFFPSARWVRMAPSIWKELATRYPFGDHTSNHPHMKGLSYAQQYDEITSGRQIVERITGVPLIPVFRAPYGEFDSTTLAAAGAAGFPVTMEWDVNVYDLTGKSDSKLLAQAIAGRNGSVITMHCGADATVRILPNVIDDYRGRGFRFVTVPDLLAGHMPTTISNSASPEPTAAVAGAAGATGPTALQTPSRISRDLLRSAHLLAILTVAGATFLLWAVALRGAGRSPRGAAGGFGGQLRT